MREAVNREVWGWGILWAVCLPAILLEAPPGCASLQKEPSERCHREIVLLVFQLNSRSLITHHAGGEESLELKLSCGRRGEKPGVLTVQV